MPATHILPFPLYCNHEGTSWLRAKGTILNSEDIFKVMQQVLLRENKIRRSQEHFWAVGLNNQNKILFVELISLGAANRVQIAPPEVFRMAIYKLAVKMILIHNHPGNSLAISEADVDLTARMIKAGQLINIDVIDHLIITERKFSSFDDKGLIRKLKNSPLYELLDQEKKQVLELNLKAEHNRKIATSLKKSGVEEKVIQKATGMSKAEIKKL